MIIIVDKKEFKTERKRNKKKIKKAFKHNKKGVMSWNQIEKILENKENNKKEIN